MIYYLFVFLAVFCFTLQFIFTRLYSRTVRESAVSALCMLFTVGVVGAILAFLGCGGRPAFSGVSLLMAAVFALVMIPYHTLGIKALALGSLSVYSTFMMLGGMLLPFLYGILLLEEAVTVGKLLGCLLLSASILLQGLATGRREEGRRGGIAFFLICLAIFAVNGMTGVISQTHALSEGAVDEWSFTFYASLLTAALALLLLGGVLLTKKHARQELSVMRSPRALGFAALLGLCMNLGNFLILLAAPHIGASIQFPLISGGTIALSAVAALLLFREKPSRLEFTAILGACLSTVLFAF